MTKNTENKITNVVEANAAINAVVENLKTQQRAYKSFVKLQEKANAKLYSVLGEAFAAYTHLMAGETKERNAKINAFKEKLSNQKSQFAKAATEATSLQLRIVRYICGNSITDKTATNYARVIKVAAANDVQNMDMTFSEWVILSGGIDNVRATKDGEAPKDFVKVAKDICQTRNAETAAVEAAADSGHLFSVALIRNNEDGTQDIVWSTNKASLTNAMLKAAGKELDKEETAQDAEQTTIDAEAELHAAANSTTAVLISNEYELEAA